MVILCWSMVNQDIWKSYDGRTMAILMIFYQCFCWPGSKDNHVYFHHLVLVIILHLCNRLVKWKETLYQCFFGWLHQNLCLVLTKNSTWCSEVIGGIYKTTTTWLLLLIMPCDKLSLEDIMFENCSGALKFNVVWIVYKVWLFLLIGNSRWLTSYIVRTTRGPSWPWSYRSWIYNYQCNRHLSPLKLWFLIPLGRGVLDATLW
jgi:hypothetical protein